MKQLFIKLLALCMTLGMLVGCTQDNPDTATTLSIDAYSAHAMGMVYFTYEDGEVLETGSIDFDLIKQYKLGGNGCFSCHLTR